jgi:hypothetical protein
MAENLYTATIAGMYIFWPHWHTKWPMISLEPLSILEVVIQEAEAALLLRWLLDSLIIEIDT